MTHFFHILDGTVGNLPRRKHWWLEIKQTISVRTLSADEPFTNNMTLFSGQNYFWNIKRKHLINTSSVTVDSLMTFWSNFKSKFLSIKILNSFKKISILVTRVIKMTAKGSTFLLILFSCYPGVVGRQKIKLTLVKQMFILSFIQIIAICTLARAYFNSRGTHKIFQVNFLHFFVSHSMSKSTLYIYYPLDVLSLLSKFSFFIECFLTNRYARFYFVFII